MTSTATGGVPYLGSKISLISKSEIRYAGILYTIDTKDSTVALSKVRSFGTEDRPTDRPVAPRDEIYEYIIFRGSDIKDIRVCQPPKPHPTLEGGLPNDPAIVQHSAIGSQKSSPIAAGGTSGPALSSLAPPDPPFQSASLPAQTSPVMDMLNQNSGRSTSESDPLSTVNSNQLEGQASGRGRGSSGPTGFYRADRARGSNQGGNRGYRGRGGGGREAFQPGRPTANPKKGPLTFDGEYDFDKANDKFKEVLEKLQKSSLDSKNGNGEATAEVPATPLEEGHDEPENIESSSTPMPEIFYDKKKSFFDSISSVANENLNDMPHRARDYRNAEFKLNKETFGVAGNRGGRGGYYNRRGYNGRGGQGGGHYRGGGGFGRGGRGYGRGGYNNQNGFRGFDDRFARDN